MEQLLAAVLRGEPAACPPDAGWADPKRFLAAAARHGVVPLLVHALDRTKTLDQWPPAIREPLVQAARRQVWVETQHRSELEQVLSALATLDVPALLMKGAALAYLYYPDPCLRPRYDTDLLVRKDDMPAVTRVLQASGYRRSNLTSGDLVMPQRQFVRDDRHGLVHAYDVHWKMAIPVPFADLLSWDDVAARAIEISALGGHARTLSRVDALLLACIHRVAHHHDDAERLLWLYDIHLLAHDMARESFEQFVELAAQKQIRAVCAEGLTLAQHWFNTRLPAQVMHTLAAGAAEPTRVYLDGRLRKVDVLWSDLMALGGWRARWQLLREHLFPPAAYMLERSGVSSRLVLPALYASRIVRGAWRWFRRP